MATSDRTSTTEDNYAVYLMYYFQDNTIAQVRFRENGISFQKCENNIWRDIWEINTK